MLPGKPPAVAMLRVADGRIVESSGNAEYWAAPPGSAVKPFVIAELLRLGRLSSRETYLCRGRVRIDGRNFTCSHPTGLPPLDPAGVIAYSCNGGIAHFAQRFGRNELQTALRLAGFRVTGVEGTLQALGETGVLTTPVQLAFAYRRLARSRDRCILEGLCGAVQFGTAQAAAIEGFSVAGKTGSAVTANGMHVAWFAGFAPANDPDIVVVVGLEGRSGGGDAAPVAAKGFKKYFSTAQTQYRVKTAGQIISVESEDYVSGVLSGESGVFTHPEALKAMAVAARTFAVHEKGRHRNEGFDFCDTTHCQRYASQQGHGRFAAAVTATDNQLLHFEGRVAFAPYTMSCGGTSEAASAVWPQSGAPYLRVHDDPFCEVRRWKARVDARTLQTALKSAGIDLPAGLHSARVVRRTSSGRVAQIELAGDERIEVDGNVLRFAVGRNCGWNLIRSDWFDTRDDFEFYGRGEGHGVGLCQRGAEAMALAGHSYREILAFYYQGASLTGWISVTSNGIHVYGARRAEIEIVLAEAQKASHSLPWTLNKTVEIYIYPDMDSYRSETGQPGWIAAQSAGSKICLQPLSILEKYAVISSTIRHELLHVVVEERAIEGTPIWFREGIVGYLSHNDQGPPRIPEDGELTQRQRRSETEAAYREACAEVRQLVALYGKDEVLNWLPKGLPEAVMNSNARKPITNNR